jgi:capsid portal protein
MVLETESKSTVQVAGMEDERAPKITVKDLSPMLQKDELFQSYIDNSRRKVQSAFQLPDLYVGYTTDFNRATALTAVETTEKQVFIPLRKELAWIINHVLLAEYNLRYVEINFRAPDVTNPEDQAKILTIVERAGGMTPNEAHRLMGTMAGDTAEDFNGEWAEVPLAVQKTQKDAESAQKPPESAPSQVSEEVLEQFDQQIQKALAAQSNDVVAVMKQIRATLVKYAGGDDA